MIIVNYIGEKAFIKDRKLIKKDDDFQIEDKEKKNFINRRDYIIKEKKKVSKK